MDNIDNIETIQIGQLQSWRIEIDKNDNDQNDKDYSNKKYNLLFINYIQCKQCKQYKYHKCYWFICSKVNYMFDNIYLCRYLLLNKGLSICAHILIMVIFEIYFFFDFIIDIENEKFIGKIDSYFRHLDMIELTDIETELIHQLLYNPYHYKEIILGTLYTNYVDSNAIQNKLLDQLFISSCKMGAGIGVIFFLLLGLSLHRLNRKYIEWKIIFLENVLMFLFLGIFEYYFFINIIMKYEPVTNEEIQYKLTYNGFNYLDRLTVNSN